MLGPVRLLVKQSTVCKYEIIDKRNRFHTYTQYTLIHRYTEVDLRHKGIGGRTRTIIIDVPAFVLSEISQGHLAICSRQSTEVYTDKMNRILLYIAVFKHFEFLRMRITQISL